MSAKNIRSKLDKLEVDILGDCVFAASEAAKEVLNLAEELFIENQRLFELWIDAVMQGAHCKQQGSDYVYFDQALSTWEEAFWELKQRGLVKGNEKDGYVFIIEEE